VADAPDGAPRVRPSRRGPLIAFVLGLVVLGVASALFLRGGTVHVPPPLPGPAARTACESLSRRLPAVVQGQRRRRTDPSSSLTAAWGSPAITLRCGVSRPGHLAATSELTTVDGVDWFAEPVPGGYRFTTTGRTAYVEVSVPNAYQPEVAALTDLAVAVSAADPPTGTGTP
jgi:Protein of unknown function (DUF3515)